MFFMHIHKFFRLILRFSRFITLFLPSLFWLLLVYGFDETYIAGATVLVAVVHECGHEAYFFFRQGKASDLRSSLSGFRIKKASNTSYLADTAIYAAGPAANIITGALSLLAVPFSYGYAELFALVNLVTAFSNLLPIEGYDGYGIINSLLHHFGKEERFLPALDGISFSLISSLTFISLYIVTRVGDSYWMAGLFLISLIREVSKRVNKLF